MTVEQIEIPMLDAPDVAADAPVRPLPLATPGESPRQRLLVGTLALLCVLGYGFFLRSFWAPAPCRPGIDENAYLFGGVNIAEHGNAGFKPANDYQFVGAMWFRNDGKPVEPPAWVPNPLRRWITARPKEGWYFPKYPLGLPALNAIVIKLGSSSWSLAVPPVAATLAAGGIYLLAAEIMPGYFALLAMVALMFGPTTLQLSELPDSHAVDLCAVVWGMWLLLRWWRGGRWWTGLLAGLLLGIAVTFRYSEALLLLPLYPLDQVLADTTVKAVHPKLWMLIEAARVLPIGPLGMAVMWRMSERLFGRHHLVADDLPVAEPVDPADDSVEETEVDPRSRRLLRFTAHHSKRLLPIVLPIFGWAVPVSIMLISSWFTTGHLTGYDATHESEGFSTADFLSKWDFTIYQLHVFGLFLLLPIGLVGLAMIFHSDRRSAWLLTLWFVPSALLYTAYYWGENVPGVGYLRFFLDIMPAVIVAAMWVLWRASRRPAGDDTWNVAGPIGAALVVTASAAVGIYISLPILERQHRGNLNLAYSTREVLHFVHGSNDPKKRPVVFVDDGMFPQLLMHLQMMTDADWFSSDAFEIRPRGGFGLLAMMGNGGNGHANNPVLVQKERMDYMDALSKGKTDKQFAREQREVIVNAIHAGRPVFAVLTPPQATYFRSRVKDGSFKMVEKSRWSEPCADHPFAGDGDPRHPDAEHGRSPLEPPNWTGEPLIRWHPQTLVLFQLTE